MSEDIQEFDPIGNATYSAEDNKLRLYPFTRLDRDIYSRVKAAGFAWAPKQELFVAPSWTPGREDLLLELCGEIEDEDYSATDRAADRAERFIGYRDKRIDEATEGADRFDAGPSTFGHQNRARAERAASRHDRIRRCAVSQWSKAEYWQQRTAGVISHALYKSSAPVRRSRILRLEAEQRKHEKEREEYRVRFKLWSKLREMDGADVATYPHEQGEQPPKPAAYAYSLANFHSHGYHYAHPRTGEESSLYHHITNELDPITAREAADLWLKGAPDPDDPDGRGARWSNHYANRLAYENAMLAEEGGTAAAAEMEPGGWIGAHQIQKINRSPKTRRVVSVAVIGPHPWKRNADGSPVIGPTNINVERLPENAYRPPTDEERAAFSDKKKETKAAAPKAPPTINPTRESAERLCAIWTQAAMEESMKRGASMAYFQPCTIQEMTQAEYSEAASRGEYSRCSIATIASNGLPIFRASDSLSPAFKVRTEARGSYLTSRIPHVVILTDKPQKPIPIDLVVPQEANA